MASQLRRVAAAARELLIDLAAEQAKVDREQVHGRGRQGHRAEDQAFTFGQLTKGKKLMKVVAADAAATPADEWTVAGTSVPKVDGRAFVTGGTSTPPTSVGRECCFGKVLRPPAFKAKLESVDTKEAEQLPGVKVVRDGDFVGVVAPTEQAAGRRSGGDQGGVADDAAAVAAADLFKYLKEQPRAQAGAAAVRRRRADPTAVPSQNALKAAAQTVKATYTIAYIAHVPLEPRAAVAEWADGKLTVWTGTQRPFGVRGEVAERRRPAGRTSPRHRAGHGLRLRRQAHRRGGRRGGPAGEGGRQAGQARLDARGGVHLGLLPPGRRDRGQRPASPRTAR